MTSEDPNEKIAQRIHDPAVLAGADRLPSPPALEDAVGADIVLTSEDEENISYALELISKGEDRYRVRLALAADRNLPAEKADSIYRHAITYAIMRSRADKELHRAVYLQMFNNIVKEALIPRGKYDQPDLRAANTAIAKSCELLDLMPRKTDRLEPVKSLENMTKAAEIAIRNSLAPAGPAQQERTPEQEREIEEINSTFAKGDLGTAPCEPPAPPGSVVLSLPKRKQG